jgi:hypothetical protein
LGFGIGDVQPAVRIVGLVVVGLSGGNEPPDMFRCDAQTLQQSIVMVRRSTECCHT